MARHSYVHGSSGRRRAVDLTTPLSRPKIIARAIASLAG